jgi:hypothetical protein
MSGGQQGPEGSTGHSLTLSVLRDRLAACRLDPLPPGESIPIWASSGEFFSVTQTEDELSVVCDEDLVPDGFPCEPGWRCLKVHGPLEFSMVGVLASLTGPLAEAGISIFAISTYDTDYLLMKGADLELAIAMLSQHGHRILR